MYKLTWGCILSKLYKDESIPSLYYLRTLSVPSSLLRDQTRNLHTRPPSNNEAQPKLANKKYRNNEIMVLPNRDLPSITRLRKFLPFKILQKRLKKVEVEEAMVYLYEDLCDDVNVPLFFKDFRMSDTFVSWFTVMELHIHLLSCRFMKEGADIGIPIRDALTETFWRDVLLRASKLGEIAESQRIKHLRILAGQFQAAFYGYDEGIQTNDMVLAAILWRRFFNFECENALLIERLVKYIRIQLDVLNEDTVDEILYKKQRIFLPLEDITV